MTSPVRPQGNGMLYALFLFSIFFSRVHFYKRQTKPALLLVNICAAMLQIGRLFFVFFYYASAAPRRTRQLRSRKSTQQYFMIARGKLKCSSVVRGTAVKHLRKFLGCYTPHPSPFSRLFLGSQAVSLHFSGRCRMKRPTVGSWFPSRANPLLLKTENSRRMSFVTFR